MKIKAAFFDVDGTLVSFRTHRVAASTIAAINRMRADGVKIFLATGRHPIWVPELGFDFDGFVSLNGGYCTTREGETIYKHALPQDDFRAMLVYQHEKEPFSCACVLDNCIRINYIDNKASKVYQQLDIQAPIGRSIDDLADTPVYQLIAFFDKEHEAKIMAAMPGCIATRWHPDFADVVPQGVSKAVGIEHILNRYGIKREETIAFGDGGNDMTMLRYAGIGVAMGNATDEVKATADHVTDSVDEDGIAKAVCELVYQESYSRINYKSKELSP